MVYLLILIFGSLFLTIVPIYGWISYSQTTFPTGRTRLVRNGMEYEIEAECTWFLGMFRCWRKLSKWKPAAGRPFPYRDDLTPKPYDTKGWICYRVETFKTEEEAEEAAIEWRANAIAEEQKHKYDGPKKELTSSVE